MAIANCIPLRPSARNLRGGHPPFNTEMLYRISQKSSFGPGRCVECVQPDAAPTVCGFSRASLCHFGKMHFVGVGAL